MIMNEKKDLLAFFRKLYNPIEKYKINNNARLSFGTSGTHYDKKQIDAEGFFRILWAVGPLEASGEISEKEFLYYKNCILHSVDPDDKAYWGKVESFDQYIVEMAALSITLIETKSFFWDKLEPKDKINIYNWLNRVNEVEVHPNNWRFFRLLVNVTFYKLGEKYNMKLMDEDKALIESFYLDEGWYCDGTPNQIDYYISWAFHYYGLLYSHYMKKEDPIYSEKYIERAKEFAKSFNYWFDNNGGAVPFGRSLTYRFAQNAFWAMCVFCNIEVLPWGQMKSLLLENFQFWSTQEIQKKDGILSIGYSYEDFYMAERYNGPGSPYWAFKSFIILAVSEEHPFWKAEKIKLEKKEKIIIKPAKMLITNQNGKNVQLYPFGQFSHEAHGADKYSKFVYSSMFGFSVSKGNNGQSQTACDNCLSVSELGTNYYVSKSKCLYGKVTTEYTQHVWEPLPNVFINSIIIPFGDWHVRIHEIDTKRDLILFDNGFSNKTHNSHSNDYIIDTMENGVSYDSSVGTTGTVNIYGYENTEVIFPEPNTNLLYKNTLITGVVKNASKGLHRLISAHYGSENKITEIPDVMMDNKNVLVKLADKEYKINIS